jgi:hypothetical protein
MEDDQAHSHGQGQRKKAPVLNMEGKILTPLNPPIEFKMFATYDFNAGETYHSH